MGLTDGSKDPLSVEKQLRQVLPPEESSDFCHRMVLFGRDICTARKANCHVLLRDEQDGGKTLFVTIHYNDSYSYNSTKYEDPYGRR